MSVDVFPVRHIADNQVGRTFNVRFLGRLLTDATLVLIVGIAFKALDNFGAYIAGQGVFFSNIKVPGFNSNIVWSIRVGVYPIRVEFPGLAGGIINMNRKVIK